MIRKGSGLHKFFCLPTFISVIGIAVLLSLGTWQLHRLQWKEILLDRIDVSHRAPAQHLEDFVEENNMNPQEFSKAIIRGSFITDTQFLLMSKSYNGQVGSHLVVPFQLSIGSVILLDLGWVPKGTNMVNLDQEQRDLTVMIRYGSRPSKFTPDNQFQKKQLYYIDPKEFAKEMGVITLLPYYGVCLDKVIDPYPIAVEPNLQLSNNHFYYAITWYFLALIMAGVYVLYMRKRTY